MDANILVSVERQPAVEMQDVSDQLAKAGMHVIDVLSLSGVITGTVEQAKIPDLRRVPGVASVDLDIEFTTM